MTSPARRSGSQAAASVNQLPGSNRLGHLLWEVSTRVTVFGDPFMREHLSLPAVGALEMIAANPGITASELARQSMKTQQAISQVTTRLVRLGYVERRIGPGRGVGLHLTDAGVAALAEGEGNEEEIDRRLCELFGKDDAEQLRALLRQARDRLSEQQGQPGAGGAD
ncbi:MAG TPA: MarR family winged helix-turn-helix transcriptional regulator [Solirubrobacteraceae bacterium]|nr:MarR family winged helix-turn-helix transcriptional regulator [Solirubrobacteraceae bacterium]